MAKKKSERQHKLSAIEGALRLAEELMRHVTIRNPMEMDATLARALEAVQWLRDYPDSLLEPLAALEHDQFHSWCQIYMNEVSEEIYHRWMSGLMQYAYAPEKFRIVARTWARTVIDVFKTGTVDLRRES